jgi:hypothetical protein
MGVNASELFSRSEAEKFRHGKLLVIAVKFQHLNVFEGEVVHRGSLVMSLLPPEPSDSAKRSTEPEGITEFAKAVRSLFWTTCGRLEGMISGRDIFESSFQVVRYER